MDRYSFTVVEAQMGWIAVLATYRGLVRMSFPCCSREMAQNEIALPSGAIYETSTLSTLARRLQHYFAGYSTEFPDELDLSGATEFQRNVWNATRLIPFGETRNYGWIARVINNPLASRAVGRTLGRNPLPVIIPCHRVLAIGNKLGGFTGGLEMKQRLLKLEGVKYSRS